jgi:hypothetical protein
MDTNSKTEECERIMGGGGKRWEVVRRNDDYFAGTIVYIISASPPKPMARSKHECLLRFSAVLLTGRRFLQSLDKILP